MGAKGKRRLTPDEQRELAHLRTLATEKKRQLSGKDGTVRLPRWIRRNAVHR